MTAFKVDHQWRIAPNVSFCSGISRGTAAGVGGADAVKAAVMVEAHGQSGGVGR
jgi:hypothetical protein